MTRVLSIKLLENCLDSSTVKEVSLDGPIDETLMRRLVEDGTLKYYPHFPRPYFRIERARQYVIQGVINNDSLRVTFSPQATAQTEQHLQTQIDQS
ncbi:MAG: hypothetical protein JXR76_08705 [Deltaproteobacteria bacterium]|nr:hypothetical protein [Deltaproteobacteria bacterium]